MTIVVCVDDRGGLLFNHRRVSSDRAVIADMLEFAGQNQIRIRDYSAKLFPEGVAVCVSADYLLGADSSDIVFVEEAVPEQIWGKVDRIVLYHWNRLYPSDVGFPLDRVRTQGKLISAVDFTGYSHDTITREVYAL